MISYSPSTISFMARVENTGRIMIPKTERDFLKIKHEDWVNITVAKVKHRKLEII